MLSELPIKLKNTISKQFSKYSAFQGRLIKSMPEAPIGCKMFIETMIFDPSLKQMKLESKPSPRVQLLEMKRYNFINDIDRSSFLINSLPN